MFGLTKRSFFRELKRSCRGCRPKLRFGLYLFEDGFAFNFFGYFIPLLFLDRWRYEPEEILDSWSIAHVDRTIHLSWGAKVKIIHLPWDYEHLKHEVLRPDGTWVKYVGSWQDSEPDGRQEWVFPYRYTLKSGEVQERTATVHIERREWRWRSMMWSPWPAIRRQSIDIRFNDEVGERTGSWKGGCIGCGYDMLPGETAEQTLRRMEKERVFD